MSAVSRVTGLPSDNRSHVAFDTFVFASLELDISKYSECDQALFHSIVECKNMLEADGQAEAAESPAPPQPAAAVPTVASGVGEPEVSSPPRPSSRPPPLPPSLPPSLSCHSTAE